jgi:parallel beta-helix repeat protein
MEPKSIAFYTAVAVSILAVLSATTFPILAQAQQSDEEQAQQSDEEQQQQTMQTDNEAAVTDETEAEDNNEAATDETEAEDNNEAATDETEADEGGASQSLTLEPGSGVASCGQEVTQDVTLTSDLVCSNGDGLIVRGSDITVNLNGYSITSGDEAGGSEEDSATDYDGNTGIMIAGGDNVAIHGLGEIAGFTKGVMFQGSSGGEVTDVQLSDNGVGVVGSNAEGIEISRNTLTNNGVATILDATNGAVIAFNQGVANLQAGIVLQQGSSDNVVAANNLFGNGANGIYIDPMSGNNNIDYNTAFGHETADMNNADGLPTNVNGNIFGENNNCGTSLPGGLCR